MTDRSVSTVGIMGSLIVRRRCTKPGLGKWREKSGGNPGLWYFCCMAYKNQQEFIQALEKAGELVRIRSFVDPKLEIAEITDRISKSGNGGKALLFENTGTDFPVLMNAYGSEKRVWLGPWGSALAPVSR